MKLRKTVMLLATTALFTALTTNFSMAKTATVDTDTLKLRKEASTSSTVLELLDNGKKLEVIEEDGDWVKVKFNGITGYVSKDYVKIDEDTSIVEQTKPETTNTNTKNSEIQSTDNTETTVSTTVDPKENEQTTSISETTRDEQQMSLTNQEVTVKIDAQVSILPLINASEISNVKENEKVTIIDEVNGWCYIQTEQISGWIRKTALDIKIEETVPVSAEPASTEEPSSTENTISNYEQTTGTTNEQTTNTTNSEETNSTTTTEAEKAIEETPISERTMYVNSASVYIRKGPGTNYGIEDSLILNNEVIVTAESGDWYKVKVGNTTGYIAKRLLSITMQSTSRSADERNTEQADESNTTTEQNDETIAETATTTSSKGQEIVSYAKQYLGCKYVYGGSGPSTFDCSGFTMYVFKHFGVNLSHSATAQSKNGDYVAKSDLQPGDLVFFKDYETMNGIGHVGIYIGDGNFIHASSGTGYCVKISTLLTGSYNTRYETARRIF